MASPSSGHDRTRSSFSIRQELQQLRGDLFDISDADSSLVLVLNKVQQLTEFENKVVLEQREEIEMLRAELERAQQHQVVIREDSRDEVDADEAQDGLASMPSFGSITMTSSTSSSIDISSSGFTNESERDVSYSLLTNQQLATKANLSQSIAAASSELHELNSSRDAATKDLQELNEKLQELKEELDDLASSKDLIITEIEELKKQIQLLLLERNKLIQEVEVYNDQLDLAHELEMSQESNSKLEVEVKRLREEVKNVTEKANDAKENALQEQRLEQEKSDRALAEAQEKAATEEMIRKEMQHEMTCLYQEKIACEKELEVLKQAAKSNNGEKSIMNSKSPGSGRGIFGSNNEADIQRLKTEIQALRGENESLRSTAKRQNDEIRSLISVAGPSSLVATNHGASLAHNPSPPMATQVASNITVLSAAQVQAAAASRKRALVLSQGSVGEEERSREYKRSISYDPHREHPQRERLNSNGSGSLEMIDGTSISVDNRDRLDTVGSDTVSALHETDNVSLLFGNESVDGKSTKSDKSTKANTEEGTVKSDHDGIRAHAEKLLYWANRASERSKSASSVASRQGSQQQQQQQQTQGGAATRSLSPIPQTIGLPPRSQSRVRKSSQLPPRCPPQAASISSAMRDGNSTIVSDKENGGSSFNREVPGAFPRLPTKQHEQQQQRKKNVSLAENDIIIHNLDYMEDAQEDQMLCCECSTSPFSGNDPQSEFYLPQLGLACNCNGGVGSAIQARASFSENPTALTNILRQWQCDFLATLGLTTADDLLRAHKADANGMSRKMKKWRSAQGMASTRSKECYVALKIWSRTCKVVLRSIREQMELAQKHRMEGEGNRGEGDDDNNNNEEDDAEDDVIIEKPHFLDITFADTHTIASISTLGQFSSVGGGGRPFEMMEI